MRLLAVVVWVGGLVFFAFVLAPTAFRVLPSVRVAGLLVGAALRVFDWVGLGCGVVFLAGTGWMLWRWGGWRLKVEFALVGVMLMATAYLQFRLLPTMDRDREAAGGDVSAVAAAEPARRDFDRLHVRSERVEGVVLLAGLMVVVFMSGEVRKMARGRVPPPPYFIAQSIQNK